MEKRTVEVKRMNEFNIIENPNKRSGYKRVTVEIDINGKKAEMTIEEKYQGAQMISWRFVTGDSTIDAAMKIQTDFSAYDVVDIFINTDSIILDAENFFKYLKEGEEAKRKEELRKARSAAYDNSVLINTIKPVLEAKGHVVTVTTTKEEYMNGRDIYLMVGAGINVGYNLDGNLYADNGLYGNDRVSGKTKSSKIMKIVETIEQVVNGNLNRIQRAKDEKAKLANAKERLEAALGMEVEEKKEWHSNPYASHHQSRGYESTYFVTKDKTKKTSGMRFEESYQYGDGNVKLVGFKVTLVPMFTDDAKLKKFVDLLNE